MKSRCGSDTRTTKNEQHGRRLGASRAVFGGDPLAKEVEQSPARKCRGRQQGGSGASRKPPKAWTPPAQREAEPAMQPEAEIPGLFPTRPPRPPRPDTCHQFVRRRLARSLPVLFVAMVKRAYNGDLAAMKLLWQLAQLDKAAGQAGDYDEDRAFVRSTLAKYGKG